MVAVLLTRPAALAQATLERLRALGCVVVHEPLFVIQGNTTPRPRTAVKPIVVLTSRTTLDIMATRRNELGDLLVCPCYCVGQKTADAAYHFGFMDIKRAAQDGAGLAHVFLSQETQKRPVLLIGGEDRHDAFEVQLKKNGWDLYSWVVYKAEASAALSDITIGSLRRKTVDAALFYSPRAARVFAALVKQAGLESCCSSLTAIGLSTAVVSELSVLPFKKLVAALQPTETDLMSALIEEFPVQRRPE